MDTVYEKRLWSKVEKSYDCWTWKGTVASDGYPVFWDGKQNRRVSRLIYVLANGPIKHGLLVRHTCDNKSCVNPNHLILGTHQDNMDDRTERNRQIKGEDIKQSKLTEKQVLEIRDAIGYQWEIGLRYGVSQTLVGKIKRGEIWKHI